MGLALLAQSVFAASLRYCDGAQSERTAAVQDRLLQVAAIVKGELEKSHQAVALVARSGLALQRFEQRYSHAGISLQDNPQGRWAVRQLYFACDEKKPRIFDQGMSGFVLGAQDPTEGYVSLLFLPSEAAQLLQAAALDDALALRLLGTTYSANAYAFDTRYQNCNQWVAELLAMAWDDQTAADVGPALAARDPGTEADPSTVIRTRTLAQRWLADQGYEPTVFDLHWQPVLWLASAIPWLHLDDHPALDQRAARLRVSMPSSIEAFVRSRFDTVQRVELCYSEQQVLIRRGWQPIDAGCIARPGDEVVGLDERL